MPVGTTVAMQKIIFSVALIAMADAGVAVVVPEVFDNIRLTAICVIGSIVGAFIAVAIFPPDSDADTNKIRRLSLKFGVSMASGIAFTPGVLGWLQMTHSVDLLMGASALVAMISVTVLHFSIPKLEKLLEQVWLKLESRIDNWKQ